VLGGVKYEVAVRLTTGPKYSVVVPKDLNPGNSRGYISFSTCVPFGDNVQFGVFLERQVSRAMGTWRTTQKVRSWFSDKRKCWKDDVVKMWKRKRSRNTRSDVDLTAEEAMIKKAPWKAPTMIDLVDLTQEETSPFVYATKTGPRITC